MEKKPLYAPPESHDIYSTRVQGAKKPLGVCSPYGSNPTNKCNNGASLGMETPCSTGGDPLTGSQCFGGSSAPNTCTTGNFV